MDSKRAQTLEALEAFIQTQKTLLATTCSDIDRLRQARTYAISDPEVDLHSLLDKPSFRLSSLPDWLVIPKEIDWSVFEGYDPEPLQKFTLETQQAFAARNEPQSKQKSALSDLQKLVKNARITIIDPVLAAFANMSEVEEESESEDEEEVRRQREREKIRELKKRTIRTCGLKLPGLRVSGSNAVFVRHDVEDESVEVDISMANEDERKPVMAIPPRNKKTLPEPPPPGRPRKKVKKEKEEEKDKETTTKNGKPKPETYKQAWSMSEQHLLEQLLEEIPEGEKYRWQKISRAMNGRRTPRQVASRVQKYFEKLKKYGIQ